MNSCSGFREPGSDREATRKLINKKGLSATSTYRNIDVFWSTAVKVNVYQIDLLGMIMQIWLNMMNE